MENNETVKNKLRYILKKAGKKGKIIAKGCQILQ
jgi:hypothetical protein